MAVSQSGIEAVNVLVFTCSLCRHDRGATAAAPATSYPAVEATTNLAVVLMGEQDENAS